MLKKLIIILLLTLLAGTIEGVILYLKRSSIFFRNAGEIRSIGFREFKEILNETPVIIDIRGKEKYEKGHIPGAILYDPEINIPREKKVVIYNDEDTYDITLELADKLKKQGYRVYLFFDGWRIWKNENN